MWSPAKWWTPRKSFSKWSIPRAWPWRRWLTIAALAEGIASARAPLPGGALELRFIGGGRQLREQALPLLFRVVPPHPQPLSREGRGSIVSRCATPIGRPPSRSASRSR